MMPRLSILALDPGETTGWAKLDLFETGQRMLHGGEASWEEAEDRMVAWAASMHTQGIPAHLVMEKYFISTTTAKKSRGDVHWSLEQIGVGRWAARTYGTTFTTQSASEAKGFVGNQVLKDLGWYQATPGGHVSDAQRHLLFALMKHYPSHFAPIAWV